MMARYLHGGALLAGLVGYLACPAGSAGETPADPPMRQAHTAMTSFDPQAAPGGRDARDLPCVPMRDLPAEYSGSMAAPAAVAGGGAANIAAYVAMHRHATQAPPFTWQPVRTCAAP